MAFFSKPPAKKPPQPKADLRPRPGVSVGTGRGASARELASQVAKGGRRHVEPAGDITISGSSLVQWTPAQSAFEVAQANPGLCAVLENAALRFASGQAQAARQLLEEGIETDADAKLSPLAWLALFDLLQRDCDKAAFDALSLKYVMQFERSAPAWVDKVNSQVGPRAAAGYVVITGRLTAASEKQLEGLRRAIARKADAKVDLMSLQSFDDVGARLLADALAQARRAKVALQVQQGVKLPHALSEALKEGREAGEGPWLLALELLQWYNDRATFEDLAINFAVTFELSPPSWEPPIPVAAGQAEAAVSDAGGGGNADDPDVTKWVGVLAGSLTPQLGKFADSAHGKAVVVVDMSEVERIDFVCAGAFLNHVTRIESQRKAVQIVGVSPIVRALLLLLGVSPRHFVKKAE